MSVLKVLTENATAHAKGFVAEQVVTYSLAQEYKKQGYSFCLRLINHTNEKTNRDADDAELYSMMSNLSGGSGLSVMPLFKVPAVIEDRSGTWGDIRAAINELRRAGFPKNITVWLDEKSVQDYLTLNSNSDSAKELRENWVRALNEAGYSVGYYFGNMEGYACPPTNIGNNTVLEAVDCGSSSSSSTMKTISIGDNAGSCKIRWAFLPAGQ